MKKLSYKIDIKAPVSKVYETMLGKETYKQWTYEFNPTSDFEGSWNKGDKMYFTGIDENGKKGGMIAEIAENIPNKLVSIRHYGILDGDQEITSGSQVENWAGAFENYSFGENDDITTLTVEVDTNEEYIDYFDKTWPKALDKLKDLSEN